MSRPITSHRFLQDKAQVAKTLQVSEACFNMSADGDQPNFTPTQVPI